VNSEVAATLRVAVDIGGTFTDVAVFDDARGTLSFGKTLSTHGELVQGIETAVHDANAAFNEIKLFLHGSTIAINTLLERTGAKTALLITEGFRDIYEIGRINRPDAYNLYFKKHDPLVPRSLRFEVAERLRADGAVHRPLDIEQLAELAGRLADLNIEAVAIILLHSYRNAAHERQVKEAIAHALPHAFITASHELSQEYREFERASTVAANAYIGPTVDRYLGQIEDRLTEAGFHGDFYAVQSTGGLIPVAHARRECVRMLESGPSAGVVGTQAICRHLGMPDAIAFDMGGTTAKAGVIYKGELLTSSSALVGGYDRALPIQIPMLDIFEVGTGGGSIARLAEGNALRVGPRSSGSIPGPACYGRGGAEPTVTDANLILGRLDAQHFLGGDMKLDFAAAEQAVAERIAEPLGLSVLDAADGIIRIAVTTMSYAVKGVTTERGLDAGSFVMVVYGGAGPLHASAIARELGIRRVLIPFAPGYFSAYGMLFSDLRYDYVRSCFKKLAVAEFDEIENLYAAMEEQGRVELANSRNAYGQVDVVRYADMRYVGQEHAVTVELGRELFASQDRTAIKSAFDQVHMQRYGTSAPKEASELVSVRATLIGRTAKPEPGEVATRSHGSLDDARSRVSRVYFHDTGLVDTPVYARDLLLRGDHINGPALIEERASTTVVQPGDRLSVDQFGNLNLDIGGR
jgi:N-methylhydantoinase A